MRSAIASRWPGSKEPARTPDPQLPEAIPTIGGIYARVPETVEAMLLIGFASTLGMVSPLTAVATIVVLGVVINLAIDLDRPHGDFRLSREPLLLLQQQVEPPSP